MFVYSLKLLTSKIPTWRLVAQQLPENAQTHKLPEDAQTHRLPENTHRLPELGGDGALTHTDYLTYRSPENAHTHRSPENAQTQIT
jgi:hypothetical protein